jgi:alpha-beta hydrolase superfamily lysophospholipase
MATFVLVHGAGDVGWYWHLTEEELRAHGHQAIAPDLPCDNDTASLDDYAAAVADAAAVTTTEYRPRWPRRPCEEAGAGNPPWSGTLPGH